MYLALWHHRQLLGLKTRLELRICKTLAVGASLLQASKLETDQVILFEDELGSKCELADAEVSCQDRRLDLEAAWIGFDDTLENVF
jgi:hypothetical protein